MKVLAVALLCLFAAVQGRSTGAGVRTAAAAGDQPWLVHLRVAVSTSGLLNSCMGVLISDFYVLTTATCVRNARFVWVRYGAVDVIRPELVTETSSVKAHPDYDAETGANDVALVTLNRVIEFTDNIKPIALHDFVYEIPESAQVCGYGANEEGGPGETLSCYNVNFSSEDGALVATSDEGQATKYDIGSPIVKDGVGYGLLLSPPADDSTFGVFASDAALLEWIVEETGVTPPGGDDSDDSEESEESDDSDDSDESETKVNVVN